MRERFDWWRDPALGEQVEVSTSGGAMRAFVAGEGEPIVVVHGALVNANLWRKVVAELSSQYKCVCLDLPLASRELPIAFGLLMHSKLEPQAGDSYVMPMLRSRAVAGDLARFLKGMKPRYTLEAIERLGGYEHPVLIAWSRDDRFFPPAHAERL